MFKPSEITVFAGHYGSGKTNLAVSYALSLRKSGKSVTIADLDIVNPYFRTKDGEKQINEAGIKLISSYYANSNVDLPSMPPETASIFADRGTYAVIDLGGDDRGAYALGRYAAKIAGADSAVLLVINKYRPLTSNGQSALEIMREIETASKMAFTGIVNNSNLGEGTMTEDVLASVAYADEISKASGLPVVMTSVLAGLVPELEGRIDNLFPIELLKKEIWKI